MDKKLIKRMIEGRSVHQVSVVFIRLLDGRHMRQVQEATWNVVSFKRYLFSEPKTKDGRYRKKDLIQFYADPGGLRTINAEDIIL